MKIEASAFVTERQYDSPFGHQGWLVSYTLRIVHAMEPTKAAISGDIPLRVVMDSVADMALEKALRGRKAIGITLDVPE